MDPRHPKTRSISSYISEYNTKGKVDIFVKNDPQFTALFYLDDANVFSSFYLLCFQFMQAHSLSTCLAAWPCSAWIRLMASISACPCCGFSCLPPVPLSAGTDHSTGPSGELAGYTNFCRNTATTVWLYSKTKSIIVPNMYGTGKPEVVALLLKWSWLL